MCSRPWLSIAGLVVVAVVEAGCPSGSNPSNCGLQSTQITGDALTLLSSARLDLVGGSFVLLGTDGNNVRWAHLGTDGQIGTSFAVPVPTHTNGPWFAVAGTAVAADHLVVAYAVASASGGIMDDLMTFSVPFDNPPPILPSPTTGGQVPSAASNPMIAMVSGRGGMHAGLAFALHGTTDVVVRVLDGTGRAVGTDLTIASKVGSSVCLGFSPGNEDMTLGFVDTSATPPNAMFVGTEIDATGAPTSSFRAPLGSSLTPGSCALLVPTSAGYALAWHSEGIGYYFGVFVPMAPQFLSYLVLSDVRVSGTPVLGGLGVSGKTYTLVFNHPSGGEVWQIDAMGHELGGAFRFPSQRAHTGGLSTQPVGSDLYGTYADYSDPVGESAGQRFLERVTCL